MLLSYMESEIFVSFMSWEVIIVFGIPPVLEGCLSSVNAKKFSYFCHIGVSSSAFFMQNILLILPETQLQKCPHLQFQKKVSLLEKENKKNSNPKTNYTQRTNLKHQLSKNIESHWFLKYFRIVTSGLLVERLVCSTGDFSRQPQPKI